MFKDYLLGVGGAWAAYLFVFGAFVSLEIVFRRQDATITERARGLRFALLSMPVEIAVIAALAGGRQALGIEPVFAFRSAFGSAIIAAIAAMLWADFLFYWFHRAQHRFLWRWHAVHHSIEHLSAVNSYHHWTEPLWRALVVSLPLSLVAVEALNPAIWLVMMFRLQPLYIHSSTSLHFGGLAKLLVDNRFHRIHHSIEPRHFNRNFAANTPLWDWVFGTIYRPGRDEWPAVGVDFRREPRTIGEWLAAPPLVDDLAATGAHRRPA